MGAHGANFLKLRNFPIVCDQEVELTQQADADIDTTSWTRCHTPQ